MIFDYKWRHGFVVGLETGSVALADPEAGVFIVNSVTLHLGPLELAWIAEPTLEDLQ
jgi:hypothetical protein